jgi:arylsulfatase A-like enzyme
MKKFLRLIVLLPLLIGCDREHIKRPNILLILADDMGYSDLGSFGSEISTPNLDGLAASGVRMTNFYAAAACSPTRTMLLSGADSHRAGMGTMFGDQAPNQLNQPGYEGYLNHDVVTIATLLQDADYNTYMTGKWHLGNTEELSPKARGFDQSFVLLQGGAGHFDDTTMMIAFEKAWFRENEKRVDLPENFFSSEFYTDKMIEYIKTNEGDDKPFFAYLAYTAPHWPLQAPEDYIKKYEGMYDEGYAALKEKRLRAMKELGIVKPDVKITPPTYPSAENWENLSDEQQKIKKREMEIYAAMVDNMDYHIGRVLDYLEKSGQRDNTIVIFMSDNGAYGAHPGNSSAFPQDWIDANFDNSYDNMGKIGSYIHYGPHWAEASTAPSRLFKGFSTEGGIKVPAIINYPEKMRNFKDQFSDEFMTILDLAPTFLELAETKHPGTNFKGKDIYPLIGKSALAFLEGRTDKIHNEDFVVAWELNGRAAIRKGDWKIIKIPGRFGTGDWELFNLKDDPGETNDLSVQNAKKLEELLQEWNKYVETNGVIMVSD